MANQTTMIADLINPQVMADMISAKVPNKLVVAPFAKVDTTLTGIPGNTITVPQYAYIGDAVDIAEGIAAETVKLATTSAEVTVKKAMKAVELTDEAVLSGYGNPVGETNNQLAKAIASKVDNDAMEALQTAQVVYDGTSAAIKYTGIVDAIDLFNEEVNTEKVIFVHPKQVTQLRKDSDFISADKYTGDVVMTGEIGKVAGVHVVPSRKIKDEGGIFTCPVIKLEAANRETEYTEDELAAVTIFLKKDIQVDAEWKPRTQTHELTAAKYYGVALTNEAKVVLAKFKK